MRSTRVAVLALVAMAVVASSFAVSLARADDESGTSWIAILSGQNEVPAHNDTHAHGVAIFTMHADGSISYRLIAANIRNVIMAHIHIGPPGVNGPVVVFLFGPAAPGGGRFDGVLATGTFTAANFVGPLAGHPMSDLIANITAGNTYANVHTNDGIPPANTGPGDFPGGEIRGPLVPAD